MPGSRAPSARPRPPLSSSSESAASAECSLVVLSPASRASSTEDSSMSNGGEEKLPFFLPPHFRRFFDPPVEIFSTVNPRKFPSEWFFLFFLTNVLSLLLPLCLGRRWRLWLGL